MPTAHPTLFDDGQYRTLCFPDGALQSRMDCTQPLVLHLEYTRLLMAFLHVVPAPGRIALIGLGGGSLLKYCHAHLPHSLLEVAEISPQVLAFAPHFGVPLPDARLRLHCVDGAAWIRGLRDCDVIVVDGYSSAGLDPALGSAAFFNDCRRALAPGGVLLLNLLPGSKSFVAVLQRLRARFGDVRLTTDTEGCNCIATARAATPAAALKQFHPPAHWSGAPALAAALTRTWEQWHGWR